MVYNKRTLLALTITMREKINDGCWPTLEKRVQCFENIGYLRIVCQLSVVFYSGESIFKYKYHRKKEARSGKILCSPDGPLVIGGYK